MYLVFEKRLRFSINHSFDDLGLYCFSADQSQYNGTKWVTVNHNSKKYFSFFTISSQTKIKDN